MKPIAIQGAAGSFHEQAAQDFFGPDVALLHCPTFAEVFASLRSGTSEQAVLAIGNSRFGDINHVYEELLKNYDNTQKQQLWISGEVYVRVNLCLLGIESVVLSQITEVHSQLPAIGQCFTFLHDTLRQAQVVEQDDTARSAELIAEWQDSSRVAIASKAAAQLHNLVVLKEHIQDDEYNVTRFVVIQNQRPTSAHRCSKSSLILRGGHRPGSLAQALNCFSEEKINLSYIQSVPIPERPFQYHFYIDIEAGIDEQRSQRALRALEKIDYEVEVLGSYQRAELPAR